MRAVNVGGGGGVCQSTIIGMKYNVIIGMEYSVIMIKISGSVNVQSVNVGPTL